MADIINLPAAHALAGTWVNSDWDTEFTVQPSATGAVVIGRDTMHGEGFVISDVSWDGSVLRFTSMLPSTGYKAGHAFYSPPANGRLQHEVSFFETWVRKDSAEANDEKSLPLHPNSTLEPLVWLQHWYASQCDGDWEHEFGVKIDTLDNPGWCLDIDLTGTELEHEPFTAQEYQLNEDFNWWVCRVEDGKFKGRCSIENLITIIGVFRSWVERCGSPGRERL